MLDYYPPLGSLLKPERVSLAHALNIPLEDFVGSSIIASRPFQRGRLEELSNNLFEELMQYKYGWTCTQSMDEVDEDMLASIAREEDHRVAHGLRDEDENI